MATKPFRSTKVSISSLDVLGDEIVHQATKIVSSTNVGSRIVLATKYFCRLILSTFSYECFHRLNSIWRQIYFCRLKIICRQNLFLSPNNLYVRKFISSPIEFQATKHFVANCFLFFFFSTCQATKMCVANIYIYTIRFLYF